MKGKAAEARTAPRPGGPALASLLLALALAISQNASPSLVSGSGQAGGVVIVVAGDAAWTDTGLEVVSGEMISFEAEGKITLQKGNPEAECGPDGLNLQTPQQPVPGRNLGALVGRVLEKVEVIEDKESKEKTVRETAIAFFVGKEAEVEMPADGRLFLGINENVTGDNDGAFTVRITGVRLADQAGVPFFFARNFSRN